MPRKPKKARFDCAHCGEKVVDETARCPKCNWYTDSYPCPKCAGEIEYEETECKACGWTQPNWVGQYKWVDSAFIFASTAGIAEIAINPKWQEHSIGLMLLATIPLAIVAISFRIRQTHSRSLLLPEHLKESLGWFLQRRLLIALLFAAFFWLCPERHALWRGAPKFNYVSVLLESNISARTLALAAAVILLLAFRVISKQRKLEDTAAKIGGQRHR